MRLSKDEVAHLATLARLDMPEENIDQMTHEIGSILEYVERIQQIDVKDVEPFTMPLKSSWRADEAFECDELTRELILSNFPGRAGDLLAAPGVFNNPKQ